MGKRARQTGKVKPTARDLALFEYIGRRGLISFGIAQHVFWEGRKPQTAKERLLQLVKAGYVGTEFTTARGRPEQVFWIEPKVTRTILALRSRKATLIFGKPPLGEFAHLLNTTDFLYKIRDRLESFTNEHELKKEKTTAQRNERVLQIADQRISVREPEETASSPLPAGISLVEIDGQYYGKMLRAKVHDFTQIKEQVVWVVRTASRKAAVIRAVSTAKATNIRVIQLKEL